MIKQLTATAYVLENNKVLLIFHRKLKKWLPPGGHLEPNELPSDGAVREVKEETGLEIELMTQENIWIAPRPNGKSFPRPYMCLQEEIPEFNGHPAHQHIDFIYVAKPIGGELTHNLDETDGMRWFSLQELKSLKKEVEIFEETYQVIEHLLTNYRATPSDRECASV